MKSVESGPRMCRFCDEEFGKIHTQECRNFKQFFVPENSAPSCMFCSKSYKKLDGLYDHLENKHDKEIKQELQKKERLCKHCQSPKYSKFAKSCKKCLNDILKKNFESLGYKYKCLKCHKQFLPTYTYDHYTETCSETAEIDDSSSDLFSDDEDISNSKCEDEQNNLTSITTQSLKLEKKTLPDTTVSQNFLKSSALRSPELFASKVDIKVY